MELHKPQRIGDFTPNGHMVEYLYIVSLYMCSRLGTYMFAEVDAQGGGGGWTHDQH